MESKKLTAERGKDYGHPLDNFERMALVERLVADCPDDVVRQALYMIGVKVTRLVYKPDHQDSIDDIQGYAETINMVHKERAARHIDPPDYTHPHVGEAEPPALPAYSHSYIVKPEASIKSERELLAEEVLKQHNQDREQYRKDKQDGSTSTTLARSSDREAGKKIQVGNDA